MMFRQRRDATRNFAPSWILAMLIFCLSILHATHSVETQNDQIPPFIGPSLPPLKASQFSVRKTLEDGTEEPLHLYEIVHRLNAAATLRANMLASIGRILLLRLDVESRIAFEEIYEALRTRYVPSYDYLASVPLIQGKTSRQQLHSVLRLMERIGTPYVSSYATMCLESLSAGRVNVGSISPTDLLSGIDNDTRNSLAMDGHRNVEVPLTFEEATSVVTNSVADDLIQPDLELVAGLMLNLPNFDVSNPEVPETLKFVAEYMRENPKPGDPILEYLTGEQTSAADRLVEAVLERILVSESASSVLREAVGLLLQNFRIFGNEVNFRTWNATELFDAVAPDFYPRSVVAIAKYFQQNLNLVIDPVPDLTPYTTELRALGAVVRQISKNSSLPEPVRETAATLSSFVAQKQREEDPQLWLQDVNVHRALEYLDAFRSPCLPEKLRSAAKTLRPYLDDKLPWNYAFGDTRLTGNPYELLANALTKLKNIDVSEKLGRELDNFIYQARYSGVAGERSVLYDQGIIFQRGDTDLVELDVYSLLGRLPDVFRDERFVPLLSFFSKPNLVDYLGRDFNMFAHTKPRALLIDLIKTASDKPAVWKDQELLKALKVSRALLEEPTLTNRYDSEELQDLVKALPAVDLDPRYLPIKLLFRKENLFGYISHDFSLAGLETPLRHIALVLYTVALKPVDKRLEESIIFALTNLEVPQLPARSFSRDDFVYLVSHLLRRDKPVEFAILKSQIYESVSDWSISVNGIPEDVLARALSYPVEELSRDPEISAVVDEAVKTLEQETPQEIELLDRKIVDEMLKYLPDTPYSRPVDLLLETANLATLLRPYLKLSSLSEYPPKKSLILILVKLMASPHVKRDTLLIKRLNITLENVVKSPDPPAHDVSSVTTEELLDPPARTYEPLSTKFNSTLKNFSESLVNWKRDVEPLRNIVSGLKDTLYDPVKELLRPENLNKINLHFDFDSRRTPKQLMVGLLHNLMLNHRVDADSQVVRVLDGVRRDVINFGLDTDLLWVLDDAGIPYEPSLAPVRLFLHTTTTTSRLGFRVNQGTGPEERFKILLDSLSTDELVNADHELARSVHELSKVKPSFKYPLEATEVDVMDIVDALPDEVVKNYPEVQKLFEPETLKELPSYYAILDSRQPVITLLLELSRLPKVSRNQELSGEVFRLYKALGEFVHQPVISGYNLRPLLRELDHARQINVDYFQKIIAPKMLSVLWPDGFHDVASIREDADLLNNILNKVLSQNVFDVDFEFERHVSTIQRDIMTILAGRGNKGDKNLLSDEEVDEILKLIPKSVQFEPIRHLVKTKGGFDRMPQSIGSARYPTPLTKLMKILDFVERHSENYDYLYDSVIALNEHLKRRYFFVDEDDVKMLLGAVNELSVDCGLVPLRLFLTKENLVKYLPSDIDIGRFETPKEALGVVLHIFQYIEKLKTYTMLQQSIAEAIEAVQKVRSDESGVDTNVKPTAFHVPIAFDLRFILKLDLKSSVLKNYLDPESLVHILPESFSFASKPTIKAKVLDVPNYSVSDKLGPVGEDERLIEEVNLLNDLPNINSTDLQPLIAAIDENAVGANLDLIQRYLTSRMLERFLPGNFHIDNHTNGFVSNSLGSTERSVITTFEGFPKELPNLSSPVIRKREKVEPEELASLIAEIPFKTCENIGNLSQDLEADVVLKMMPLDFNLTLFKTRKLKLLEILKKVEEHPDASGFRDSVQTAKTCVEEMQDVPKLRDQDINRILKSTDLNEKDLIALKENCRASDLAEYLPIAFNVGKAKSARQKLEAVINSCKRLNSGNSAVCKALKRARTFTKKLPLADLTWIELKSMFKEICCGNFTSIKPLVTFADKNDLVQLLPSTLNLDKKSTLKRRLLAILIALRSVEEFRTEEMLGALNAAEEAARALPDRPVICRRDIHNLKKLPVMMLPQVKPFRNTFVLRNLMKVVPPSFNVNDYRTEKSRLARLINYSANMIKVKIDDDVTESWNIARELLLHEAEEETLEHLTEMVKDDEKRMPMMLYMGSKKHALFDPISITHGFEYENIEDRARVVLKYMLQLSTFKWRESLLAAIESLISQLSVGHPTEYEIREAINEIPDANENRDLKIYLRCQDVMNQAKGLTLTPEHKANRLILDMFTMVKSKTVNPEIIVAIDRMVPDVQKRVWDAEIMELFKQIPKFKVHEGKLKPIKSYYVLHGPVDILGSDYHLGLSDKPGMLRKLVEVLLASPDLAKDKELEAAVKYLSKILTNRKSSMSPEKRITMQDVDIASMLSVLPKMRSEKLIRGLLKFFTDPKLRDTIGGAIDPSKFDSQGSLMQEIIDSGLKSDRVNEDPNQLKALEYVKDKIPLTGAGALPIKLKSSSERATMNPDLIGLLKSVDIRSANLSSVIAIAEFFDTEYDPLIHGRGFDHQAHDTRGTYLKALLQHLIANADVQDPIKRHAEVLINFVKLDGPGAEPVDTNEDTTSKNRVFHDEWSPGVNPQGGRSTDVSAHFKSHPQDPWENVSAVEPPLRSLSGPTPLELLMKKERRPSPLFEEERSALKASINRILNLETEETVAYIDSPSVSERRKAKLSKREIRDDFSTASDNQLNDEEPFDPETATFSPDKALVDVKTNLIQGPFNTVPDKGVYITQEEAAKLGREKQDPIQPLTVDQDDLPAEMDSEHEPVPHTASKNPGKIDLVSMKLFIRNDTDPSIIRKHRDLSDDISIEEDKNCGHENETVKKDLTRSPNAKCYALPSDIQTSTEPPDAMQHDPKAGGLEQDRALAKHRTSGDKDGKYRKKTIN